MALSDRITALEVKLKAIEKYSKWALGILVPSLLGWVWFITSNVIAMKQQLADGGNTKLVAELKEPKSPDQLRASLNTVIAQVQTAQAAGKMPDANKAQALSTAISQVVQKNPQLPEAWNAAAELVSYKTLILHPKRAHLAPCIVENAKPELKAVPGMMGTQYAGYFFSNCSLNLETIPPPTLRKGDIPKDFPIQGANITIPVILTDGEVIYEGGAIAPDASFLFENCAFYIKPDGDPSAPEKSILRAALENDLLVDTQHHQS
jgi:hypothetical protein